MPRSVTEDSITLSRPGHITYTLPTSRSSNVVTITIPSHSTWSSGLHWHEEHTEFLRVIQGIARISLGSQTFLLSPSDGTIVIPRYTVHEWSRADRLPDESFYAQFEHALVVQEWTDPADGLKCIFFRNLNTVILDETSKGGDRLFSRWWFQTKILVIFHYFDNFPVYWSEPGWLRSTLTHVVLSVAALIGQVCGFQPPYMEYKPDDRVGDNLTTVEENGSN